jgi:hypothetical protein
VLLDPSLADRVGRMSQFFRTDARGEYLRAYFYRMKNQAQRSTETLRLAIDDYPADDSLRMEFLRPWYGDLAMDKAPAEIAEVATGLSAPAAQVLSAARHAFKSEWREVALVDAQLAEIPWTSAWYAEALELRVNWRLWVTDARERKRFGDEAISMIDRVAIMSPTLNLYGLRTRAGFAAERPDVVVESLSNYARLAAGMVKAGVNTRDSLRKDASALSKVLVEVSRFPQVDTARIEEVRAEIAALTSEAGPN